MKDQLQVYGQKLLKNIDRVGIAVFAALLAFAVLLFLKESGEDVSPIISPPASAFDQRIEGEDFDKVQANLINRTIEISERDEFRPLIMSSLFDAQSVLSSQDALQQIEDDFRRARSAFEAGNLDEASQIVENILRRNANHRRTQELQGQIAAARAAALAAETPQ